VPNRIHFPPYALDPINECLWKDSRPLKLRPKAFAVLAHLISRPGELVTKKHLINAVWEDTFVGDAVLKVAIRQIREVLSDDPKSPRFIETAHRRGYRFIGEISARPAGWAMPRAAAAPAVETSTRLRLPEVPAGFVGREHALAQLHAWLARAGSGACQVAFVTGEAGIGKTTLLHAFARSIARDRTSRVCYGQCLEQYGMSEPYLPVLDAIRQLCREEARVVDVLRAHAPMWLMQMPSLVTSADRELFAREAGGATRERMLREISDVLDVLTRESALVLVLEDLHWSDLSTLDLISYVARRRLAARVMVVGTYRPAELIASRHPLKAVKQELVAGRLCEELPLEYLTEDAIGQHLAARFPGNRFPAELAALIHERTEGNPLFMVNTIDHLVAERLIEPHEDGWRLAAPIDMVKVGVPESIRQLIETQIERLDARDQRVLEAASVAGTEFSVLAVSAALDHDLEDVEARCEELSRRHQFIEESGAQLLPNGQAAGRFGFRHAVYRHVFYDRMSAARRMQLHRRVGERGEDVYGAHAKDIAAELAMHFEQAGDHDRAARYLQQGAVNAIQRSAYREAIAVARRGLELLAALPDTDERASQELRLRVALGVPLIATKGYAAPEVGSVYVRARRLCERLGPTPEMSQVLWGLWTFHTLKAELSSALPIAAEILRLAERVPYPGVEMRGHWAMEITSTHLGNFRRALEHFDRVVSLYDHDQPSEDLLFDALNPGVAVRGFAGWCRWCIGQPDRAVVPIQRAVRLARDLSEPHGKAHALAFAAVLHQLRRERPMALRYADATMALAAEHGLVFYGAMAQIVRGWALIGQGDDQRAAEEIRQGLAGWQGTGARLMRPHFLALLAEACAAAGLADEERRVLDEALALAHATGERMYEAEICRLQGEQRLRAGQSEADLEAAEACFERSLGIARGQEALSLELRAATSLARLHRGQARHDRARDVLLPIYERFVEGFDTRDLSDARELLGLSAEGHGR
jgi:DNA-binding winged helix-turn-helix (wHTH) protein/predicted ATPase